MPGRQPGDGDVPGAGAAPQERWSTCCPERVSGRSLSVILTLRTAPFEVIITDGGQQPRDECRALRQAPAVVGGQQLVTAPPPGAAREL